MSYLHLIEQRHRPDRLRDFIFVVGALLLVALSIGSLTSHAAGQMSERQWVLTVLEGGVEVIR
jgi:hypothetical protein